MLAPKWTVLAPQQALLALHWAVMAPQWAVLTQQWLMLTTQWLMLTTQWLTLQQVVLAVGVGTAVVSAGPATPVPAVSKIGASSVTNDAMKSSLLKMFSSNGQIPHPRKPAMGFSGVDDLWKALLTSAAMS